MLICGHVANPNDISNGCWTELTDVAWIPAAWFQLGMLPMNIPHGFPILWAAISHSLNKPLTVALYMGVLLLSAPGVSPGNLPKPERLGFPLIVFFFKVMILFNAILLGVEIDIAAKRSQNDMPAWFGIAARTPDDSFFWGAGGGGKGKRRAIVSLLVGEKRGCLRTCHHQNTKRNKRS